MVTNKLTIALIISSFAHLGMAISMSITSKWPSSLNATSIDVDIVEVAPPPTPKRTQRQPLRRQRVVAPVPVVANPEPNTVVEDQPLAPAPPNQRAYVIGQVTPEMIYQRQLEEFLQLHKRYPRLAKRMKKQGRIMIRFELERNGRLVRAEISKSSTHPRLDEAALKLVQKLNGQMPFPHELKKNRLTFVLPVEYQL